MTSRPFDDEIAERVAAAVLATDGVAELTSGPTDQFRSYLPGGRSLAGVRVDDHTVTVDIVAWYGSDLISLGDRVAHAITDLIGPRSVTVAVDDIKTSGETGAGSTEPAGHR